MSYFAYYIFNKHYNYYRIVPQLIFRTLISVRNIDYYFLINRKDSPFYRELKNSGIVFDLDAYRDNIKQGIREKLEKVVTDPNGPPKEEVQIMGPDGQVIDALSIEINGVNVYIGNPPQFPLNPIETDTIDQTMNPPLVKLEDVVAGVSSTRESVKNAETTYSTYTQKTHVATDTERSRADASQMSQITGVDTSKAPNVFTTFEKDGSTTTQVTPKNDGPSL